MMPRPKSRPPATPSRRPGIRQENAGQGGATGSIHCALEATYQRHNGGDRRIVSAGAAASQRTGLQCSGIRAGQRTITALWTRVADENATATGRLTGEMDELYTANDRLGVLIGASKGPAVDLANAIDDMTTRINDAQTAAALNQAAFDALSPAMMAAAIELGIFKGLIDSGGHGSGGWCSVAQLAAKGAAAGMGNAEYHPAVCRWLRAIGTVCANRVGRAHSLRTI